MSRDELFLIKLNEFVRGDTEKQVHFHRFAKQNGFREAETINIVKLLAKANLVLKIDEETIQITSRGCKLAQSL